MEIKQIRQFLTVARTLNFRRAAEELNIAQPPLSVSIGKLEMELGVKLFERHHQKISLSPAGKASLAAAQEILFHVDEFRRRVNEVAFGQRGRLRIGFVGSATCSQIPGLTLAFRSQYPDIELQLEELCTDSILKRLEAATLDIGIIRLPLLESLDFPLVRLENDCFALALPHNHPLANRTKIDLAELSAETFIMYDRTAAPNMRAVATLACETSGFMPRLGQEAAHIHTILALVESGLGIALVPAVLKTMPSHRVRLVNLTCKGQPIEIGLGLVERPAALLARNFRNVAVEFKNRGRAHSKPRGGLPAAV